MLELGVVLLLVLLNGFFAMSELAVVSARPSRLREMERDGERGAATALRLTADPGGFLSVVQIGITLVGIFAGAFSGATLAARLGGWLDGFPMIAPYGQTLGMAGVVVLITYLSLVLGELVPKQMALANAERIAVRVARPLSGLARFGSPVVFVLRVSTRAVLRLLRVPPRRNQAVSEDEVRIMIAEGVEAGVFHSAERELLEGVMQLADRSVGGIMTPRMEVSWLDLDESPEEIGRSLLSSPFSTFLASRGAIDEVVGLLRKQDLLEQVLNGGGLDPEGAVRPALVVHESISALRMLDLFKTTPVEFAVVVDEYGSLEGVVTLTDILEAIAGDLSDEQDAPTVMRRADGTLLIDGMLPVHQARAALGLGEALEAGGAHTLAGLLIERFGRIPREGDALNWQGWRFEVMDMDGRRIDKILAVPAPDSRRTPPSASDEDPPAG